MSPYPQSCQQEQRHGARNRVSRHFDFWGDFQQLRDILAVFVLDPSDP
jgi:hypothetical protein